MLKRKCFYFPHKQKFNRASDSGVNRYKPKLGRVITVSNLNNLVQQWSETNFRSFHLKVPFKFLVCKDLMSIFQIFPGTLTCMWYQGICSRLKCVVCFLREVIWNWSEWSVIFSTVKACLELMCTWVHKYLDQTNESHYTDIIHHGPFYAVVQAILYVFVFRNKDIFESKKGMAFSEAEFFSFLFYYSLPFVNLFLAALILYTYEIDFVIV